MRVLYAFDTLGWIGLGWVGLDPRIPYFDMHVTNFKMHTALYNLFFRGILNAFWENF